MPFSFRLTTIFYVMALLAAALTAFGAWGAITTAFVLAVWMLVRVFHLAAFEGVVILLISIVVAALLVPTAQMSNRWSTRNGCSTHLREIGFALQNYWRSQISNAIEALTMSL
jgi:hypothetical protein